MLQFPIMLLLLSLFQINSYIPEKEHDHTKPFNFVDINDTLPVCKIEEPLTERTYQTYHRQIINKINFLHTLLHIRQNFGHPHMVEEPMSLPDFPVNDPDQLRNFDRLLECSEQVQREFVQRIGRIGGKNSGQFARNILRWLMTDQLALQLSWSGQRNTIKFKDFKLCSLMIDTIAQMNNDTLANISQTIKIWLQHANDRIKSKLR